MADSIIDSLGKYLTRDKRIVEIERFLGDGRAQGIIHTKRPRKNKPKITSDAWYLSGRLFKRLASRLDIVEKLVDEEQNRRAS